MSNVDSELKDEIKRRLWILNGVLDREIDINALLKVYLSIRNIGKVPTHYSYP